MVCIVKPKPMPTIAAKIAICQYGVSMPSVVISAKPEVMIMVPAIGNFLYLPVREIALPLKIEVVTIPNINGINFKPADEGLSP